MSGVNKVILLGNLGRDPEIRHTKSGDPVCNFSIATSRKKKNGEEETEWHRITAWGKTAELCNKYLSKGRQVFIEGRIRTSTYEKNGEKRYSTEIVADRVQFIGSKDGKSEPAPYDPGAFSKPPGEDAIPF